MRPMNVRSSSGKPKARSVLPWAAPIVVALAFSAWAPNARLTAAALVTLLAIVPLTWRPGEPPVLLFAVSYQWIQVATKVFHANVLGIQVGSMMAFGQTDLAIWLSFVGLLALAVGMRLGLAGLPAVDLRATAVEIDALSLDRLWLAYAIAFIGKEGIRLVAWLVPGLTQALLAFGDLRWFFFFLCAYGALAQRRRYAMLTFAVALEVVFGFTGFFSAFKEVFFVLLIAYLTVRPKFGMRNAATVGVFIGAVVALGALWMTVRGDYRTYVSRGERAQVVHIDFLDRLDRMREMLMGVD